jgi:hypothetical protein
MTRLALLVLCGAGASAPYALAQDSTALAILRAGCADDAQKFCANVPAGGGRVIACLKEHRDSLSDQCKQAAARVAAMSNGGASANAPPNPAPAAPPAAATPTAGKSSASSSHRSSASAGATPGLYLLLKKVQITDPGAANVYAAMPAVDLLIPSTWDLKGTVAFGGGKGGCFSDLMAVSWEAKSPDGSSTFQGAPNYSWQYTNDPQELRKLNDPNRRQLGAGGKPCPVAQPTKAEDYFRQNVLPTIAGGTVVSTEAYPELNQMVRQQLGLPAADGGNGQVRTEAIRVRTEFSKDGKPMEAWVTVAMVTRVFQSGRGAFWDCHAIDVMAFSTSKGKLDANDRLFKVLVGSVRPTPQWQATTGNIIAKFYQAEAQKEAVQDQQIADFQRKVIETINATTANAQRGAQQSAFGESQIIRGVQTFRDPATGSTYELSNQYDHAWLNGSNEYVMSDDPNFNPNSQLSGNWSELQVVHPSP